jgi:hypothetical protein
VFPQYAFVATAFIKIRFHSSTFSKTCFSQSAVVKTFLAGSAFARYIFYLPNFTIFNQNKSPTNFPTLQNGGVRLDGIPKKRPKLCQSAVEQKIANFLYLPNLTIFSKTKSFTTFKTLQKGGVDLDIIF